MVNRFDIAAGDRPALDQFIMRERADVDDVESIVRGIITQVRSDGFAALSQFTANYDRIDIDEMSVKFTADDIDAAVGQCDAQDLQALEFAAARIRAFHEQQIPQDASYKDDVGVTLGWRWTCVDSAGLYAPGGRAAYPSSVLMNAIPAKVAGVPRLALVTPTPDGVVNPLVLAAAKIAGVDEIYRVGGAQAIAALAYGAGPIAPVDVIVGPGNSYVAEAKRQVFGVVGIDSIAGPSEILVVADAQNDPAWIAADLLSQAEHDPSSQSILITDNAAFADAVCESVDQQIKEYPRREITTASWHDNGAVVLVGQMKDSAAIINFIAPEHLELAVDDPDQYLSDIRHAGAIFLGRYTPEALGDYVAGPDHVLPTSRTARYASGLSVIDFLKRTSLIGCDKAAFNAISEPAARLADAEGLPAHAQSIRIRKK